MAEAGPEACCSPHCRVPHPPPRLAVTQRGAEWHSQGPYLLSSGLAPKDEGAGWPQPNRAGAILSEAKLAPPLL